MSVKICRREYRPECSAGRDAALAGGFLLEEGGTAPQPAHTAPFGGSRCHPDSPDNHESGH